jgi:hypothetical protein
MVGGDAKENRPETVDLREIAANLIRFGPMADDTPGSFQVHTQARGPHWIAWITRPGETQPDRSIVLIAASQEQAEARARQWAEQQSR